MSKVIDPVTLHLNVEVDALVYLSATTGVKEGIE
jgi:hypothetical protein